MILRRRPNDLRPQGHLIRAGTTNLHQFGGAIPFRAMNLVVVQIEYARAGPLRIQAATTSSAALSRLVVAPRLQCRRPSTSTRVILGPRRWGRTNEPVQLSVFLIGDPHQPVSPAGCSTARRTADPIRSPSRCVSMPSSRSRCQNHHHGPSNTRCAREATIPRHILLRQPRDPRRSRLSRRP